MRKFYCFAFSFLLNGALFPQSPLVDSLKAHLSLGKDDTSRVLLLSDISFEYTNNQADTALYYAEQSLRLARRLEYKRGEAVAIRTYARCLSTLGNFPKAIESGLKSIRMFEEMNDEPEMALAYGLISDIYQDAGDYEHALSYSMKSNDYFRNSNRLTANASLGSIRKISLAVTASIYERIGKFDSGLLYAQQAYDLDVKETGGRFGWLNLQMGKIQAGMKHTDLALAYLRHSLPLVVENNTPKDLLEAYNSIAKLYSDIGNSDSSIYYARESLRQGSPSAYEKGILEALTILSENYKTRRQWDSTLKYLEMSVALRDKMYGQQQEREIQNLSFLEQLRQQDMAITKARLEKERTSNLQMLAMGIFIVTLISGVAVMSRRRPVKVVRFLGVIGLLLAFEFVALLAHPLVERWTNDTPVYSLLLLVLIASVLVPSHHYFERVLKRGILEKRRRGNEEGEAPVKEDKEDVLI